MDINDPNMRLRIASHAILTKAHEAAVRRWSTIAVHLGRRLRNDNSIPTTGTMPREPHAPGFAPTANEVFVAQSFTLDLGSRDVMSHAFAAIDRACSMLELTVRQRLRARGERGGNVQAEPVVPPAVTLSDGDRIYPIWLAGANSEIRVVQRHVEGTTTCRVDFELLLGVQPRGKSLASIAARLLPAVAAQVAEALDVAPKASVLLARGNMMDAVLQVQDVCVMIAIGDRAKRLRDFGQTMAAEAAAEGNDAVTGGDDGPQE